MNNKKVLISGIIAICIAVVAIIIAIANWSSGEENLQNKVNTNISNTNSLAENVILNEIQNTLTSEVVTEINNGINNNNVTQNTNLGENVTSEVLDEEPTTAEEKAVQIATKDWKENHGDDLSNITIKCEGMDSTGKYIVGVRNSTTTAAIARYDVSISDGTFTKKEMQSY